MEQSVQTPSHKITTWTILIGGVVVIALLGKLLVAPWGPVEGGLALLGVAACIRGLTTVKQHPSPGRLIAATLALGLVAGAGLLLLTFTKPLVAGYTQAVLNGPQVVMSEVSPDKRYNAYVVNEPAIDGPDQTLFVEHSDGTRYVCIAELPADVDAIQKIHWSPAGELVIFQTRCSLIAAHVPGYQTVRIPLAGDEWKRKRPFKGSPFSVRGKPAEVTAISFPHAGTFEYRLAGQPQDHRVDLNSLLH